MNTNIDKKLSDGINSRVNAIIARFLIAVLGVVLAVVVLTATGIFLTTMSQMLFLSLAAAPSAIFGILILCSARVRNGSKTKYILCALMCIQAFAVAMAGYSYVGTVSLVLPVLLAALYPRSRLSGVVSVTMIICGMIVPPLALMAGFWDGGYFEFLYDLTYGRPMDTATLSSETLSVYEQIDSALRFCSTQNVLIIGGFSIIGQLIYKQTNKSFETQINVILLSETDELTGLFNRNCFERRLSETAYFRTRSLVCFYFDVNGLHEMNNKKGHKAGDIMLQFVGKQIQNVFGRDNSFRIGGDEFVTLTDSMNPETLPAVKEALEKIFASQEYHVAVGYASCEKVSDVNSLVLQAEQEMYRAKSMYYVRHDRRR